MQQPLLSNPLEPGTIIDRYRIIGRLAVGGMAELYLADARGIEGFEKRLVLKRIHPQHLGKPEYVSMFLDEARIAATLHHPNIAQVYDIGNDGGTYFFTMEHVDGRDVRHIWQEAYHREEAIPLEHTINICCGVLAGLHAAHEKRAPDGVPLGIVHRDVSPTNVIVTWEGNVKLIDFGIAKAKRRQTMTRNGAVKGKSCSMSPEQARGKEIDRRSDVFSLGIMLWELSVGEPMFAGEGDYETLRRIVDGEIDLPSSRFSGYDRALEKIVMKALAHSADDRFQTAEEMLIALDDYAREREMSLAPYSLSRYLAHLFPDRNSGELEEEPPSPPLFLVESGSELELPDPSESLDVTLDADSGEIHPKKERAPTTSVLSVESDPLESPARDSGQSRALHIDQLTLPRRREVTPTGQVSTSSNDAIEPLEIPEPPGRSRSVAITIAVGAALVTLGVAMAATLLSADNNNADDQTEPAAAPQADETPAPTPTPAAAPTEPPATEPAAAATDDSTDEDAEPGEAQEEEILAIDEDDAAAKRRREERKKRRREERRKRREAAREAARAREAAAGASDKPPGDGVKDSAAPDWATDKNADKNADKKADKNVDKKKPDKKETKPSPDPGENNKASSPTRPTPKPDAVAPTNNEPSTPRPSDVE